MAFGVGVHEDSGCRGLLDTKWRVLREAGTDRRADEIHSAL